MNAEGMVNEEVTCSDRISYLPQDLLLRILSLIPVRTATSTIILSKRWKSVWTTIPNLVYDDTCPKNISSLGFDVFCSTSLKLHEALQTLTINLRKPFESLDTLLFPNIRSSPLEMTISCSFYYPTYHTPITFPSNLRVFETLVVLKLQGTILVDVVDSPVCFPSLRTLHLLSVEFSSRKKSLCALLSACPVLEDLYFQRLCSGGTVSFTLSVPSLQRLFITTEQAYYSSDDPSIEINAPALNYLYIFDRSGSFNFIEAMPKLVEAHVSVNLTKNGLILKVLTLVKRLSIDLYPSKDLQLTDRFVFNHLLHLEIGACYNIRLSLLLTLLKDIPNLRTLNLKNTYIYPNYNDAQPNLASQPSLASEVNSVPECLSFRLETLEWIDYSGTHGEKEAAVYILRNARRLKTATISLRSMAVDTDLMIKELKSMSKASTSCQLIIEF